MTPTAKAEVTQELSRLRTIEEAARELRTAIERLAGTPLRKVAEFDAAQRARSRAYEKLWLALEAK